MRDGDTLIDPDALLTRIRAYNPKTNEARS